MSNRNIVLCFLCLFFITTIVNSAILNEEKKKQNVNNWSTLTNNQQDTNHGQIYQQSNMTKKNINIRKKTFKTRVSRGYLFYEVNYIKKDEDKYKEQQLKLYDSNASQRNITQIRLKWPVKELVLNELMKIILESMKIEENQITLVISRQRLVICSQILNEYLMTHDHIPVQFKDILEGMSLSEPLKMMTTGTSKQNIILKVPLKDIYFYQGKPVSDSAKIMTDTTPKQSTSQTINIPVGYKIFQYGKPVGDPPKMMTDSPPKQSTSQAMNIPKMMTDSPPKQSTSQAINTPIGYKMFQYGKPVGDPPKMMTDSPPKQSNNQKICVWKASLNLSQDNIQKCLSTGLPPQNSTTQKQQQTSQTNNQTSIGYYILIQQTTKYQNISREPLPNQQGNYQLNIPSSYFGNPQPRFSITYTNKYWSPIQMFNEDSIFIQKTIKYHIVYENTQVRNLQERGFELMRAFYEIPDIKKMYILTQSAQIISTNITYFIESVKMPTYLSLEGVYVSFIGEPVQFI